MPLNSASEWSTNPPRILVAGDGPLAVVLEHVLGGTVISVDALDEAGQEGDGEDTGTYRLLEELHTVIMAVPLSAGLADVARWVDQIWSLVERLSSVQDQHDLRWVFVPVTNDHVRLENGLGAILAVPTGTQLASHGYAIWCAQQPLEALVGVWQSICPKDLLTLRARRNGDARRQALSTLLGTLQGDDPAAVESAVNEVARQFPEKQNFLLDVFCRPPDQHLNGSKLRQWLREIVTRSVTPHLCSSSPSEVEGWLLPELAPPP